MSSEAASPGQSNPPAILVTGAGGFIGYHLARRLLEDGHRVIGIDNLNAYYDVSLKEARLEQLRPYSRFTFARLDLTDRTSTERLFAEEPIERVAHLAAQAGVRYSVVNPHAYTENNITGFLNILEGCRHARVKHLVYASSSSVYGGNERLPSSVHDRVDHPISLYAATKKANELMAHAYAHLFAIPCTGLRFFTVYGPWGRPDMALFHFTKSILEGRPIQLFNNGKSERDYTYVDDIVESLVRVISLIPQPNPSWSGRTPDPATSFAPFRIYNIGNNSPVDLLRFVEVLEDTLGMKAEKQFLPVQPGDVLDTYADVSDLVRDVNFTPNTPIELGIQRFVQWYREYYGL